MKGFAYPVLIIAAFYFVLFFSHGINLVSLAGGKVGDLLFGLGPQDSVADYRRAPIDKRSAFHEGLCSDGRCITAIDWQCGFTTETWKFESDEYGFFLEALSDCFSKVVRVAEPAAKLSKIERICGRKFMTFDPQATERTPDDCAAAGGQWGQRLPLWDDEWLLLLEAGVR